MKKQFAHFAVQPRFRPLPTHKFFSDIYIYIVVTEILVISQWYLSQYACRHSLIPICSSTNVNALMTRFESFVFILTKQKYLFLYIITKKAFIILLCIARPPLLAFVQNQVWLFLNVYICIIFLYSVSLGSKSFI